MKEGAGEANESVIAAESIELASTFPSSDVELEANRQISHDSLTTGYPLVVGSTDPADYEKQVLIGRGSFSEVYTASFKGITVALKIFDLENCSISLEDLLQEVQTMSQSFCPHILRSFCCLRDTS